MPKFTYTILYVQDVAKTLDFYEKAFEFKRKFLVPDGSYGELDTGATTLSFASIKQAASNLKSGFTESSLKSKAQAFEIGITTTDVDSLYQHAIKCGAVAESEPSDKPHGQRVSYVRDLDGFLIEICTPME